MYTSHYDYIVIGAGLVGLSVAYQLKLKQPDCKILILEKEDNVAKHQSGHNSGVIHSGIYYKPGSLKAQNCISGYQTLIDFAQEHNIAYDICGKLIVAVSPKETAALNNIYQRGVANGLTGIKYLNAEQIKEREPHCAGVEAIHVPQTGIIDYPAVATTLLKIYHQLGGESRFSEPVLKVTNVKDTVLVTTSSGQYLTNKLITCAGLFSDRVASYTEKGNDLRIIPFRGEYYELKKEKQYLVKHLIYPVPDPSFPFLGVHFTRMVNGGVEAGPNAVLAFKREGYKFFDFSGKDCWDTFSWPGFWKIVAKYGKTGMGEIYRSLSKSAFTKALQALVPEIQEDDLVPGGAGIRAQACDRKGILIDDFNILKRNNIVHVRNAPSPAATSSLAIGKYISSQI
ncbi:L-2-hydroxyglutarate oxidase [Mucilaginibacter lacusdianchii]|uniref:L-2-hydroxyglutarate oxidase n=1 Tax=Mucilaginibacter lacusdianchii TaxID=2684211 RepID=UPI00131D4916|nr:L-2-hydroxyglutarate oxidase [Mucilaginibacter sp. JXJ CY 39]